MKNTRNGQINGVIALCAKNSFVALKSGDRKPLYPVGCYFVLFTPFI
jgi:hypothetical protein